MLELHHRNEKGAESSPLPEDGLSRELWETLLSLPTVITLNRYQQEVHEWDYALGRQIPKPINTSDKQYESGEKRGWINLRRFKEKTDVRTTDDPALEGISKEMKQHDHQSEEEKPRFHRATHY